VESDKKGDDCEGDEDEDEEDENDEAPESDGDLAILLAPAGRPP
jgi:hypothetical protein